MRIGDRIKVRRQQLNMSQEELAQKLSYSSKSSISRIESNRQNLTQNKIQEIAAVLDTTPAYLMGWEDNAGTITTNIGNHNITNANTNSFNSNPGTMREAIEFIDKDSVLHKITDLLFTYKKEFKKSDLEYLKTNIDYFIKEYQDTDSKT